MVVVTINSIVVVALVAMINDYDVLFQDGLDNTVVESRWSCYETLESADSSCYISYELQQDLEVDHVTICEQSY